MYLFLLTLQPLEKFSAFKSIKFMASLFVEDVRYLLPHFMFLVIGCSASHDDFVQLGLHKCDKS